MRKPFDHAWAVLKAEVYMSNTPMGETLSPVIPGGVHITPIDSIEAMPNYNKQTMFEQNRLLPMRHSRVHAPTEFVPQNAIHGYKPAHDDPMDVNQQYLRGGSVPRLTDKGSFVGINAPVVWQASHYTHPTTREIAEINEKYRRLGRESPLSSFTISDELLFDEFARNFGKYSAHENIHDMINDEIDSWATSQVGNLNDEKSKQLRSLGHEYGAYTATEPENMREKMLHYGFAPYLTGERDIKELHPNFKVSDQTLRAIEEFNRRQQQGISNYSFFNDDDVDFSNYEVEPHDEDEWVR